MSSSSRIFVSVLTLLVIGGASGCTFVQTAPSGSGERTHISTVGVARVVKCKGQSQVDYIEREDGSKQTTIRCEEIVHAESSGFTGWDVLDAALTGFISWMTFGAISL